MKNILMWTGIVGLGGFFFGLMIYSFYMVFSSKDDRRNKDKFSKGGQRKEIRPHIVGRA